MIKAIDRTIDHLEQLVQEETALLKDRQAADLDHFNFRKSQGLYELSLALRQLDERSVEPSTLERLQSLRSALEVNQGALSVHLQAVREIADIVSDALFEAESDGTYEAFPQNGRGGRV